MAGKTNYFVTVLTTFNERAITTFTKRSIGYFPTLEEAIDPIIKNKANINEGKYTFAVIEEVDPGVHKEASNEHWYMWRKEDGKGDGYHEITFRPRQFFSLKNFWAMGSSM